MDIININKIYNNCKNFCKKKEILNLKYLNYIMNLLILKVLNLLNLIIPYQKMKTNILQEE